MRDRHVPVLGAPDGYTVGDYVPLVGTFRDEDGALADPDTATVTLVPPDGSDDVTLTPTSDSEGVWSTQHQVLVPGTWLVEWEGTGAVADVSQARFVVHPSFKDVEA